MPQIQRSPQNRVVNHLGLAVPDCEAAVAWYTSVLGFRKLQEQISIIDRAVNPDAAIFRIYGSKCQKLKLACLTTGNGVGLEVFEFLEPKMTESAEFNYTRGGFFHIAITDSDPEALLKRVLENGGKKIGETVMPFAPHEDDEVVYFADPWGNTIEVVSCSWEQLMGGRGGGLEHMESILYRDDDSALGGSKLGETLNSVLRKFDSNIKKLDPLVKNKLGKREGIVARCV